MFSHFGQEMKQLCQYCLLHSSCLLRKLIKFCGKLPKWFKIESENNSRPSVSSSWIFIYQIAQRDLLEFVSKLHRVISLGIYLVDCQISQEFGVKKILKSASYTVSTFKMWEEELRKLLLCKDMNAVANSIPYLVCGSELLFALWVLFKKRCIKIY